MEEFQKKSCGSNNEEQRGVLRHSDADHGIPAKESC